MGFFERLKVAFSVLFGGAVPAAPAEPPAPKELPAPLAPPPTPAKLTPEQEHASALYALGLLQREGRLIDFVREDITGFSDADVGAAARAVHQGCRKVLEQYLSIEPVRREADGANVTVPAGYDANQLRLTGNVTGQGPWTGALRHHGWHVTKVSLPTLPTTVDVKVLAPAEVELQ